MDINTGSYPYLQYLDFYLYENIMRFLTEWREAGIIDDDLSTTMRSRVEAEMNIRRNRNINQMDTLIREAFHYRPPQAGMHPERLLLEMARGEF
jgi:hypothetical protein